MTTKKCRATTRDGAPCNAFPLSGSDYCFHHDPARAAHRRQARRKGGLARHGRRIGPVRQAEPVALQTMSDVTALLQRTINHTLQLENSLQRARTIGYLAGLYIRALDSAELEERLTELERVLQLRGDLP